MLPLMNSIQKIRKITKKNQIFGSEKNKSNKKRLNSNLFKSDQFIVNNKTSQKQQNSKLESDSDDKNPLENKSETDSEEIELKKKKASSKHPNNKISSNSEEYNSTNNNTSPNQNEISSKEKLETDEEKLESDHFKSAEDKISKKLRKEEENENEYN
mgnify:FL=1